MMSLLDLLPVPPAEIAGGRVMFDGRMLLGMRPEELRRIRGREIGFVFQNPMTSLNPVFSVGFQLMEPLRRHLGLSRRAARARAVELLEVVGIPDAERRLSDYPHQFSGGMCQRAMIAIALSCRPRILIADEPTTALDVTIQSQILELIETLRRKIGMAVIWITHDLGVVAEIAERVLVMYAGQIVEHARVEDLFTRPRHPYTRALLRTIPTTHGDVPARLRTIPGQTPTLVADLVECPFRPRCEDAFARCRREVPQRIACTDTHDAACFLVYGSGADAPAL